MILKFLSNKKILFINLVNFNFQAFNLPISFLKHSKDKKLLL